VEKIEIDTLADRALGIGFPSYGLAAPKIVERFVQTLPRQEKPVPAFLFSTHAWSTGNALTDLAEKLSEKNIYTVARQAFAAPSNGARTFFPPDHFMYRRMVRVDPRLPDLLDDFVGRIDGKLAIFTRKPFHDPGRKSFGNRLMGLFAKHVMERRMYRNFKVLEDKCIGCGRCVRSCPDDNLVMEDGKARFVRGKDCLKCMRCISLCPVDAILFGESSRGKGRYTADFRDSLVDKVLGPDDRPSVGLGRRRSRK
jgi:ferredoxin